MGWIETLWERAAAWPGTLRSCGDAPARCAELGGHLWQPLPGMIGNPVDHARYRYLRCVRCGRSERRVVTSFGVAG